MPGILYQMDPGYTRRAKSRNRICSELRSLATRMRRGSCLGCCDEIMPWEFYLHYGDIDMLKNNYEGMKGYIKYMLTWTNKDGIMFSQAPDPQKPMQWLNLGDWAPAKKLPPNDMVHTFYLWRCADFTAKTAKALGKNNEAAEYSELAERTKAAFHNKYYDKEKGTLWCLWRKHLCLKNGSSCRSICKSSSCFESRHHSKWRTPGYWDIRYPVLF